MNPSSSGGLAELNRPSDPNGFCYDYDGSIQLNISRDIIASQRTGYLPASERAHQMMSREDLEEGQVADLLSGAISNRLSQLSAVEEEDDAKLNQEFQNYLSNKSINNTEVIDTAAFDNQNLMVYTNTANADL